MAHYLDAGARIQTRLNERLPDLHVALALSVPLAVLDSLHRQGDGIYVIYRGAETPENALRHTRNRIAQRWSVTTIIRWNVNGAFNSALWTRASDWTQTILEALAGWTPDDATLPLELIDLPEGIMVDPESPHVAALETVWRAAWWLKAT